ncbi:MAG: T9SS type A sorting domain-containing protein, partial [Flavobacteriia bacterium]
PNPNTSGTFRLTGNPESVEVYDTSGKPISFDIQKLLSQTILKLTEDLPGVFFLKCTYDGTSTIMKLVCL